MISPSDCGEAFSLLNPARWPRQNHSVSWRAAVQGRQFLRTAHARVFRSQPPNGKRDRLSKLHVAQINYILKKRARRYIAAGREEWLHAENVVASRWSQLREVLLSPKNELWRFGGELFVRFNGRVHYQDAFGRTAQERDFLRKPPKSAS